MLIIFSQLVSLDYFLNILIIVIILLIINIEIQITELSKLKLNWNSVIILTSNLNFLPKSYFYSGIVSTMIRIFYI